MSRYKVGLRLMLLQGGRSRSPGLMDDCDLSDILDAVAEDASIALRTPASDELTPNAIARFRVRGTCITLEALTGSVTVESPPSDLYPSDFDSLPVYESDDTRHYFIHLRPSDVVNFDKQSCKIKVLVQNADQSFAQSYVKQEEVLVKSSLAEPGAGSEVQDGAGAGPDDEETEHEDDDLDAGNTSLQTPVEAGETLATYENAGAATVMDTPVRPPTGDDSAVFSTAPDRRQQLEDNEVPESSPAARAAESQGLRSKKQAHISDDAKVQSPAPLPQAGGAMSNASENSDSQWLLPPRTAKGAKPLTTYGSHGTPRRQGSATPKTGSSKKIKVLVAEADKTAALDSPGYDQSSEPMDESGAAGKAAARSTRRAKRSLSAADDDDGIPTAASSAKKQKIATEENEAAMVDEDEDVTPTAISNAKKQKRATEEDGASADEDEAGSDDDIMVDARTTKMPPVKTPTVKKPAAKKTKKGRGRKSKVAAGPENEAATSSPPPSSGKLKRPARKTAADDGESDDDGSGDVISVAQSTARPSKLTRPNSSPHVRVSPRSISEPTSTPLSGKPPSKALLSMSSHNESKKVSNWLSKQGVSIVEDVPGKTVNFVCVVGNGELHTTAKMLRSLVLGKKVVTDQWITDSMDQDQLLDLDEYLHDDIVEVDRSKLFKTKTIFITTKLKNQYGTGFANVRTLAADAGASRVDFGTARQGNDKKGSGNMIFIGHEDDEDTQQLINTHGKTVYKKEMLTQSIIRGEALLEDEDFQIASTPKKTPGKKGRKK